MPRLPKKQNSSYCSPHKPTLKKSKLFYVDVNGFQKIYKKYKSIYFWKIFWCTCSYLDDQKKCIGQHDFLYIDPLKKILYLCEATTFPGNRIHILLFLRCLSYYYHWFERILYKLPSRGQGRSPLKYTICGICISVERKVRPFKDNLDFH